jgi:hypothetical protein
LMCRRQCPQQQQKGGQQSISHSSPAA